MSKWNADVAFFFVMAQQNHSRMGKFKAVTMKEVDILREWILKNPLKILFSSPLVLVVKLFTHNEGVESMNP